MAALQFLVTHSAHLPAEITGTGVVHFLPFCFDTVCFISFCVDDVRFVSFCFCPDVTLWSETRAMARARLRCPKGSNSGSLLALVFIAPYRRRDLLISARFSLQLHLLPGLPLATASAPVLMNKSVSSQMTMHRLK